MNNDIVDLFAEEVNKKEKKLNRKIEKEKLKEEKRKKKKELELEKQEDKEFSEFLEKIKEEEIIEVPVKNKELKENKVEELFEDKPVKKNKASKVIIIIFSILLIVVSLDFAVYSVMDKANLKFIINNLILVLTIFFYLLSIHKEKGKSVYQIFSIIGFICFMLYNLYVI